MSSVDFPTATNLELTTSLQTLYTVPSTTGIILRNALVKVTNYSTATRLVDVYGVANTGTSSVSNADAYQLAVPPKDYVIIPIKRLAASAFIQAKADAASALTMGLLAGDLYTPGA
jgi:hypothetical protein